MNKGMRLWGWPATLASVSLAGLLAALLGGLGWDLFSWLALGSVVVLCGMIARKS